MYSENLPKILSTINKNKDKYKILTREEEIELISKYKDTNPTYLKELLICHNICLAISFSKKYSNTSVDYDSLLQDAFYGLAIAAEKYDEAIGVKFSRYAYIWIKKYALSSYYERHNMYIGLNSISLDMSISNDNSSDGTDTILSAIFDVEHEAESSEYDKYLECASTSSECEKTDTSNTYSKYYQDLISIVETSANISQEDKQIFNSMYVKGETLKQISEALNKSVQIVRYKRQKVLNYLKDQLSEKYGTTNFSSLT